MNIEHKFEMKVKDYFFETWCSLSFGEEVTVVKIEVSDVLMSDVL